MLLVEIHDQDSQAAPGAEVPVTVTVTNNGPRPVEPVLEVAGLDGGRVDGGDAIGTLAPGESATTTLRVALPDDAAAGTRQMAVVAGDRRGGGAGATATFSVHTASAAALSMHVSPRKQRGRMGGRIRVELHNHGTESLQVALTARGDGVSAKLRYPTVTLAPGGHARVPGRLRAHRPAVLRERHCGFVVSAQGASTPTRATGTLTQLTLMPRTFRSLVALLLLVALWAGGAVLAIRKVGSSGSAAPTTTVAAPPAAGAAGSTGDAAADTATAGATGAAGPGGAAAAPAAGTPVVDAATGATATGEAAAELVQASASIGGTIDGPEPKSGVSVRLERVSIGDVPSGTKAGKVFAQQAGLLSQTTEILPRQDTITDEGGHFRFADGITVPGLYRITVSRVGFDSASVLTQLSVERPISELAITLVPAKGRIGGRVAGSDGQPIGDATVTVVDDTVTYSTRTASTGDIGSWSVDGVNTPSSYVITASAAGFGASTVVIALKGGETRGDVGLTLTAGTATIVGIVSSRGDPVGGIDVKVTSVSGDLTRTTTTLTDTSVRGRFTVPALPFGRYTVTFTGDGWLTDTREITVSSSAETVNVDDFRRSTATIQGRVFQDAVGACEYPVPGVAATVTPQPCGNVGVTVRNDTGVWRTTSASGTGEFRISGIPAGTYTVTFERFSYLAVTIQATVGAGDILTLGNANATGYDPVRLTLIAGSDLARSSARIVLRDDSALTTTLAVSCLSPEVTMSESGGPPQPVAVARGPGCPTGASPTDPVTCVTSSTATGLRGCLVGSGGIRIEGLSPGAKTFTFSLDGFDVGTIVASVPTNGLAELGDLRLLPLGSVAGQLTGVSDTPVAGGRLFIHPTDANVVLRDPHGATDGGWYACTYDVSGTGTPVKGRCVDASASGDFGFRRALPTGTYEIVAPIGDVASPTGLPTVPAVSLDHERRTRTLQAQAGQLTTFDLSVRRYGAVAGVIQTPDASGAGYTFVDGASVTVTATGLANGAVDRHRITIGSATDALGIGHYRVDRLLTTGAQGGYDITFSRNGFGDVTLHIPNGVPFNTELLKNVIMLSPPVSIDGSVGWFADPADSTPTTIDGASVQVAGISDYIVLDSAPYHESVRGSFTTSTGTDGTFTSPGTAPRFVAGEPSVTVSKPGFVTRTVNVSLLSPTNGRVVADVVLEPVARTLNGTVSLTPAIASSEAAEGVTAAALLQNLTVTVRRTDGALVTTAPVQSNGVFAVANVRPGAYDVTISGQGVSTTTARATVHVTTADDEDELPALAVKRRGVVIARVVDTSGTGVGGVTVEVVDGTRTVRTAITCIDPSQPGGVQGCPAGTARIGDLDLLPYTIRTSKLGWKNASSAVDLRTVPVSAVGVQMLQFGTITGRLLGGITSTDPNAAPIVNALVTAKLLQVADTADSADVGREVTARTDASGTFTVTGAMDAGTWSVHAAQPGYVEQDLDGSVVVTDGRATAIGTYTLVAQPADIRGKVTDETNGPLANATITLQETGASATTGTDGLYSFLQIPARTYTIEVTAEGRRTITKVINLRPGDKQQVDVAFSAKVGQLGGKIDGQDDPSAPKVAVTATITLKQGTTTVDSFTTSSDGTVTRNDVPAGSYTATISATGYDPVTQTVNIVANQPAFLFVTLPASVSSVTVTIRSSKTSVSSSVFSGLVVHATKGSSAVDGVVGAAGTASFSTLTPGTWTFRTQGATTLGDPHAEGTAQTATVIKSASAVAPSVTFTLNRYEGITATLSATDDTDPPVALTGATVRATLGSTTVTLAETATPGTYSVRVVLVAGAYAVSATKAGFGPATATAAVTVDDVTDVTASATTMHPLTVTVASANGDNLVGVTVTASPGATGAVVTATSGSDGTALLSLPAGTYTLTTTNAGNASYTSSPGVVAPHGDTTASATVAAGSTPAATTITLSNASNATAGIVHSQFQSGNDMVLAGAAVKATGVVGKKTKTFSTVTIADGSWSLALPANVTWTLTTTAVGHQDQSTVISTATPNSSISIVLARNAISMSGTVTLQGGSGVSGVTVELRSNTSDTLIKSTTTTVALPAGGYSFSGLDPFVTYRVTFNSLASSAPRQPLTKTVTASAAGSSIRLDFVLAANAGTLRLDVLAKYQNQSGSTAPLPASMTLTVTSLATTPSIDPLTITQSVSPFTVVHLPVGSYKLSLDAPGYGTSTGTPGPFEIATTSISSNTTKVESLTVSPLPRDVTITVVHADATAATEVTSVTLTGGGATSTLSATPASGVATFTDVPVTGTGGNSYTLGVAGTGLWTGGTQTGFDVQADSGATPSALTYTLTLSNITVTVKGRDDSSTTFANATALAATGLNPQASATAPSATTATVLTGTGGVYTLRGLLPTGGWSFAVDATGYQAATATTTTTAGSTTAVNVLLTRDPVPVTVRGGSTALAGVTVIATKGTATEQGATDSSGVARLVLAAGDWTLTTSGAAGLEPPYADLTASTAVTLTGVAAAPAVPGSRTLSLDRYERLTVDVVAKSGTGATAGTTPADTAVTATEPGGTVHTLAKSGTHWVLAGALTSSTTGQLWTVTVTATGYDTRTTTASITADTDTTTSVTIYQTGKDVSFTVRYADGSTDFTGVTVVATSGAESVTVAAAGSVTLALAPGTWSVTTDGAGTGYTDATPISVVVPNGAGLVTPVLRVLTIGGGTPATTVAPTTTTTVPPTTVAPTTVAPTTLPPTTLPATTVPPTTLPATTVPPTTIPPTTLPPTTVAPTTTVP